MYMRNRKIAESEEEGAIRMAISLLAYKENTEKELFRKLLDRGCTEEDAKAAVRFAVEKNYLCEERYFQRFAERCAIDRLFGKRRVIQEARRKGFSERTIKEAADFLKEMDFDELCYRALEKGGQRVKGKNSGCVEQKRIFHHQYPVCLFGMGRGIWYALRCRGDQKIHRSREL